MMTYFDNIGSYLKQEIKKNKYISLQVASMFDDMKKFCGKN